MDRLAGESRDVLGHLARNIFLINQKSKCHIDFVEQDLIVEISKSGVEYRFIMSVLRKATELPFIHDLTPLTEIFFEGIYDRYDYKGGVVIDIGGYIGDSAVYFAKNGAREVYTYEPNPVNFGYLLKNIDLNGESDRTKAFELAVSRERRELKVPDMGGAGSVFSIHSVASYDVKNIDPLAILSERGPVTLLKVDCKGCELELFDVALNQISAKVKYIIADSGRLNSQERTSIINNLQKSGFSLDSDRDSLLYLRNIRPPIA
jgi:FkbM family methyltransferase